ncbi:HAMP domain-containing sensor histidine kinase [Streptomyces sp. Pv4-95]|uniref:ATP-binding protein n=1 Tax=Streptomyces sp. Pv4-95 TaxID=3049543 RepID=UPI0038923D51
MDSSTAAVLGGLAALVGSLTSMVITFRVVYRNRRTTIEISHGFERLMYEQTRNSSEAERFRALLPELIERIPEETFSRVAGEIAGSVAQVTNVGRDLHLHSVELGAEKLRLTQEIAHSLRTPLAQIEAAALSLETQGLGEGGESLQRIRQGVDICKCFISAYRNHGRVQGGASGWSPDSISKMLMSAISFYAESVSKFPQIEFDGIPDEVAGYANDFIIAALLPLVENSVEAVPDRGSIALSFSAGGEFVKFVLVNDHGGGDIGEVIFERGYTTKEDHQGVGLSVSKGLIEEFAGGAIGFEVVDGRAVFTVSLPGRR